MPPLEHPLVKRGVALPTPFDVLGTVNAQLMVSHAKNMLKSGCDTLVPFGTTGEGAAVSGPTRRHLCNQLVSAGVDAHALLPCVYGPSAKDAALDIQHAFDLGCRGVLLVPPYYFKDVTDDGLFNWYAEVFRLAGEKNLPTLAYHIPSVTSIAISAKLVSRLRAEFPSVMAGVKDSGGDWDHTSALLAEHRDLTILIGHEGQLARGIGAGACGTISGCMNFAPKLVSKLARGEEDERIDILLDWLFEGPIIPNIKALVAEVTGQEDWRIAAAPLQTSTQSLHADIAHLLK